MADTLSTLSLVAFVLAGVFFAVAIVLFIVLRIPRVIDYFTNRSAKRSVKQMVSSSGSPSKSVSFNTSTVNRTRGRLTEQVDAKPATKRKTGKLRKGAATAPEECEDRPETGLLSDNKDQSTHPEPTEEATEILAPETESLDEFADSYATSVLPETIERAAGNRSGIEMTLLEEILYIHTQERI